MALLADLPSGKVYLDTNVFIYAVEAVPEYAVAVEALFGRIDDRSIVAVTDTRRGSGQSIRGGTR
jgi:hypothetical protein